MCVCANWLPLCLSVTPWTIPLQVLLFMGFSRQEYWSGLPCPSPGDFPNPGTEPASLKFHALVGGFFTTSPTWEVFAPYCHYLKTIAIYNNHSCLKFYFCDFNMVSICLLYILLSMLSYVRYNFVNYIYIIFQVLP